MGLYVCMLLQVGVLLVSALEKAEENQCLLGGGVNPALLGQVQRGAHDLQANIACNVGVSAEDRDAFVQRVLTRMGLLDVVGRFGHVATFYNAFESCRSSAECPGSVITWCVHLYHPTEDIQLCLNESGIVNETDYTRLLQLQCYFNVPSPSKCPPYTDNCIDVKQPEHLLDNAILTCHSNNPETDCTSRSYTTLFVEVVRQESELPYPLLQNETSHLVLGETSLFLCTVYFTENKIGSFPSAGWFIDDVKIPIISEEPYCSQINGCSIDPIATTRDNRVRAYESIYGISNCPLPVILYEEWLWIDNVTAEDAQHLYRCSGFATYYSPSIRAVQGDFLVVFTAVFPLLDITITQVPHIDSSSLGLQDGSQDGHLTFMQGGSFQWPCVVTAGEGDQLQWLLENDLIPSITGPVPLKCPHDELGSLYVMSLPVEDLGGYSRGFNSVLVACNLSFAESTGIYQCQLNRSREDPVEVWSATVSIPSPTELPPEAPWVSIGLYFGVSSALLLALIVLAMIILCVLRHFLKKKKRGAATFQSAFATTQVTFATEMGRSLDKEEEVMKSTSSQCFSDPLEFPREKLIVSDTVLGQGGFGQVIQARADGIIKNMPYRNIVAIKTCQENAPPHEINDLWEELQLMKGMKPHENIINLLGHCTTPSGPLYLIIEFAIHGSLKDYLHQCMEVVEKLNHTPRIIRLHRKRHPSLSSYSPGVQREKVPLSQQSSVFSMTSQISRTDTNPLISPSMNSPSDLSYTGPIKTRNRCLTQDSGKGSLSSEPVHDYINCKGLIYMEDVMNFALQIACGLQHLEKLQVTHCDLAARNILIAEGFVLKIGDFGMARENSRGKRDIQGRIPVKWSAPEAIEHQIFTHQSDIWSYGVVLWEILTYGQSPFKDHKISYSLDPFVKFLKDGNRLPCPEGCPSYIYDFMMCCWSLSPEKRPSANDLVDFLSRDDEDDTQSLANEDPATPTPCEVLAQSELGSETRV